MNSVIELFCNVAEQAYWKGQKDQEFRRPMRVGEAFSKLPEYVKEKLKTLKSDDTRKIRSEEVAWMCHPVLFPHRVVIADSEKTNEPS